MARRNLGRDDIGSGLEAVYIHIKESLTLICGEDELTETMLEELDDAVTNHFDDLIDQFIGTASRNQLTNHGVIDTMKHELLFEFEKETKRTVRYTEITDPGKEPVVGTLYIHKTAMPNGIAPGVRVSIQLMEPAGVDARI